MGTFFDAFTFAVGDVKGGGGVAGPGPGLGIELYTSLSLEFVTIEIRLTVTKPANNLDKPSFPPLVGIGVDVAGDVEVDFGGPRIDRGRLDGSPHILNTINHHPPRTGQLMG